MKTRTITVGDIKDVEVPDPESILDLRKMVSDRRDILYLARRGFDQVRRTHLLRLAKQGKSERFVRDAARDYHYHRGTRAQ